MEDVCCIKEEEEEEMLTKMCVQCTKLEDTCEKKLRSSLRTKFPTFPRSVIARGFDQEREKEEV